MKEVSVQSKIEIASKPKLAFIPNVLIQLKLAFNIKSGMLKLNINNAIIVIMKCSMLKPLEKRLKIFSSFENKGLINKNENINGENMSSRIINFSISTP